MRPGHAALCKQLLTGVAAFGGSLSGRTAPAQGASGGTPAPLDSPGGRPRWPSTRRREPRHVAPRAGRVDQPRGATDGRTRRSEAVTQSLRRPCQCSRDRRWQSRDRGCHRPRVTDAPLEPRTRLTRLPERQVEEASALAAVLDAATIAHLALAREDGPVVLPVLHVGADDRIVLHGSKGVRYLPARGSGRPSRRLA